MEKTYSCLFAGMKINIVPISGELKTTFPLNHFSFLLEFLFPYLSESCSFFLKRMIKMFSLNTLKNTTQNKIEKFYSETQEKHTKI